MNILLHYYCRADEHEVVQDNPPIWAETRKWFLENDLLKRSTDGGAATYKTTARANVLIEHILALPLPEYRMPT